MQSFLLTSLQQSIFSTLPSFTIRLIEAQRIFDLLQQNIQNPTSNLTYDQVNDFLKRFGTNFGSSLSAKVFQQLNKQGAQMTGDRFAINLAKLTSSSIELVETSSLASLYNEMKAIVFTGKSQDSLQLYQQWDNISFSQFLSTGINIKSQSQSISKHLKNIEQFYSTIQPYIDGMQIYTFQNSLQKINYCLSIVTLLNSQEQISRIFTAFTNSNLAQHISSFLISIGPLVTDTSNKLQSQILADSENILRYFKCLSYYYGACKFKDIKNKFQSGIMTCLFYEDSTFPVIASSYIIPQPRIKYQVSICLALMTRNIPSFIDWLLSNIDTNFIPMLAYLENITDQEGLYHALVALTNIVKYTLTLKNNQLNPLISLVPQFNYLALWFLQKSLQYPVQGQCLHLLSLLLAITSPTHQQVEQLKITNKVYGIQDVIIQVRLIPATMRLLEMAIVKRIPQLVDAILNDSTFSYFLDQQVSNPQSPFILRILHIIALLVQSKSQNQQGSYRDYTKILIQKKIIEKLIQLLYFYQQFQLSCPNPTLFSITAHLIFNALRKSLNDDYILEHFYDRLLLFTKLIPFLFKKCSQKSRLLDAFMLKDIVVQQMENVQIYAPNYYYFDRSLLVNIFRILYVLTVGISRRHKRFAFAKVHNRNYFQRLNEQVIRQISNILDGLLGFNNRSLIEIIFRERINLDPENLQTKIPFFKLIHTVLDEMTYVVPTSHSLQFLKAINDLKKNYCNNLLKSGIFKLHQLQVQNIQVYLTLSFKFKQMKITRQIPHKFQLPCLKSYIKQFLSKQILQKPTQIKDIILQYQPQQIMGNSNKRYIQNQVQYRDFMTKQLQKPNLEISFIITDIKMRNQRNEMGGSFIGGIRGSHGVNSTQRSQRLLNTYMGRQNIQARQNIGRQNNTVTGRQNSIFMTNSRIIGNKYTTLKEQQSHYDPRASYYSPHHIDYSYGRDQSPNFGNGNRNR